MKITRENVAEHLLEYQFNLIGVSSEEVAKIEGWQYKLIMNSSQFEEFKKYAIPLLKKVYKFNTNRAKQVFAEFLIQFGVTIK